jgi:hypothetical protein
MFSNPMGLDPCVSVLEAEVQGRNDQCSVTVSNDVFDRGAYESLLNCAVEMGCTVGHDGAIYPPASVWGARG